MAVWFGGVWKRNPNLGQKSLYPNLHQNNYGVKTTSPSAMAVKIVKKKNLFKKHNSFVCLLIVYSRLQKLYSLTQTLRLILHQNQGIWFLPVLNKSEKLKSSFYIRPTISGTKFLFTLS